MLKLIAEDFIHPDQIAVVMPLYEELIALTKLETGCMAYDLFHDLRDLGHFVFIEEWVDRAALDQHVQSEHFQRLVPLIDAHTRQAPNFTHLQPYTALISSEYSEQLKAD